MKRDDRKSWKEAAQLAYRKPGSVVRTVVSLPSSIPDQAPAPLADWQVRFWQSLFEKMTPEEQRKFLWTEGDPESKKAFLMRYGAKGIIE